MRLLLSALACVVLAGCHGPDVRQANTADQANESVVERQMQNGQDAVDDEIANDAAADAVKEANAS